MIRRLMGWVLSIAQQLLDDTVPERKLHSFLRVRLQALAGAVADGSIPSGNPYLYQLHRVLVRLDRSGFQGLPAIDVSAPRTPIEPTGWRADTDEPIVRSGKIDVGGIEALRMAVDREEPLKATQRASLEALLRHVEVWKQGALRFVDPQTEKERWQAVASMSLLFNRYAQRVGDFRYLNAALKLNDWAYGYFIKGHNLESQLRFLLALSETEATFLELTA